MICFSTEIAVRDRINERLKEAEHERLAKAFAPAPKSPRRWRPRLSLGAVRRFVRLSEAS